MQLRVSFLISINSNESNYSYTKLFSIDIVVLKGTEIVMFVEISLIDIVALSFLISLVYSSIALNTNHKKAFYISISLTIFMILAEIGTVFAASVGSNLRSLHIIFNVFGFSLSPLIPLLITMIFNSKIITTYKLFLVPTIINIAASILSAQFGIYFLYRS